MGGHAVLGSSFDGDVECVVSISAPVEAVDDALLRKVTGRKLFICANEDNLGAAPRVLHAFETCPAPKMLLMVDGKEHSRGLLAGPYGADVIAATLDFWNTYLKAQHAARAHLLTDANHPPLSSIQSAP